MPAKIWEIYQQPAYAVPGSPVSVYIAVKNDSDHSDTIWVTASFDSTVCINHAGIGIPAGYVFKWWTCNCGNFMAPSVTVHIEAGHGGSGQTIPDDVYDFVIYPGTALDCGHGGPYTGNPGIPIQFNCFAQGGVPPYSYQWDFGDQQYSEIQNPTHTYLTNGVYDVKLTVYDSGGRNIFKYTTATIGPPPVNYDLTVTINPDGWGEVPPFGFHGNTISYPENTVVTLQAFRIITSRFDRWSGDINTTENPVDVLMDGNKNIVANFVPWSGCMEGETKCVGYDKYICQNNEWVLLEQNSPDCGYNPDYITCYRCVPGGTTAEQQQFPGPVCPEGWYPDIPTCEEGGNLFWWWLVALFGAGVIVAMLRKRK